MMYRDREYIHNEQHEQHKRSEKNSSRCANCEIEFLWSPTLVNEKTYCCTGCARGGPCCCDYSQYQAVKISGVMHYGSDDKAC